MNLTKFDPKLCRRIAAKARENVSLVRQILGVGGEQLAEQLEAAERIRDLTMAAIERGVDTALGEVSRQQGAIAPNIGAEARRDGISYGRSLFEGAAADSLTGAD